MPQAVAVPIATAVIGAGGTYLAAKKASDANKHATDAQSRATQDALGYQRQRDADRRARYDEAYQDYRKRYDSWLQQFYGWNPGAGQPASDVRASGAGGAPLGLTLADLSAAGGAPQRKVPQTLADLGSWNDWGNYGVS
jgi:hypothetical protein